MKLALVYTGGNVTQLSSLTHTLHSKQSNERSQIGKTYLKQSSEAQLGTFEKAYALIPALKDARENEALTLTRLKEQLTKKIIESH